LAAAARLPPARAAAAPGRRPPRRYVGEGGGVGEQEKRGRRRDDGLDDAAQGSAGGFGSALVWSDGQEMELSEGGIVFLPKNVPHGYRITSDTADLLMICTPAGIEGMFRHAGRDLATPRPDGFRISPDLLAEAADAYGQVIVGPPR
ncbi:cupin domain-containing protein, partial [Streptomyces sp. NPDC058470]|uniref:cupin domain-containing protein n=1 Tax=Streptomyces sp. NPDC058470 TaxID=3346515 RepID=UPI00366932DB